MFYVRSVPCGSRDPATDNRLLWTLLDPASEFEAFGGLGVGLAHWELTGIPEDRVAEAFIELVARGLLHETGWNEEFGESLWQLTPAGRRTQSGRASDAGLVSGG